jgi:hypothetical protein
MAGPTQKPPNHGPTKDNPANETTSRARAIRATRISSIEEARSILDSFDFLGVDDVANEEDLAFALRQMAAEMAKIQTTKELAKAAAAIAFIWEENAYQRAGTRILEVVNSRIQSIATTSDQLSQISNKAIDEVNRMEIKGKEFIDRIDKATSQLTTEISDKLNATQESLASSARTYAQIANSATRNPTTSMPPSATRPAILNRRPITKKQILIDFERNSNLPQPKALSELEWVTKANVAIDAIFKDSSGETPKPKVVATSRLRNGGIVLELDNADSASEIRARKSTFAQHLGVGWQVKEKLYTVMGKFIPVNYDWSRSGILDRICEESGLEPGGIVSARWMVDPTRRRPEQTVANVILKFREPDITNRAIRDGLLIAGKRIHVQLLETEPMRCLNCQDTTTGHLAADCRNPAACANCGHAHRTAECKVRSDPSQYRCIPCKSAGHASWDRNCPTFRRRLNNMKSTKNDYRYIVTEEEWTWERTWKQGGELPQIRQIVTPPQRRSTDQTRPPASNPQTRTQPPTINATGPPNWQTRPPHQPPRGQGTLGDHGFTRQYETRNTQRSWADDYQWTDYGDPYWQ